MLHNRKIIILLIVIVAVVLSSVIVLYRGFFRQPASPPAASMAGPGTVPIMPLAGGSSTAVPAPVNSGRILPYGNRLDFSLVQKYNADNKLFAYPVVSPAELGTSLGNIFKPSPALP